MQRWSGMSEAKIAAVQAKFAELGISFELHKHAAVMNAQAHAEAIGDKVPRLAKNLFVKAKPSGELFLIVARHNADTNFNKTAKLLGVKECRMADAKVMEDKLGVAPGSATPLAVMNDANHEVTIVIDKEFETGPVGVHPLTNEATVVVSGEDLKKFVESYGNKLKYVEFETAAPKAAAGGSAKPAAAPKAESKEAPKKQKQEKKEGKKEAKGDKKEEEGTGTRLAIEYKKTENFPMWYQQVITRSEMIEFYDISGCYILRPWSYSIWEHIQSWFDAQIKKLGVRNAYFPLFVSQRALQTEKDHVEGFAPEVAWVTRSGKSDLEEPIAVRPTSETIMYPAFAKWIRGHRDLPLRLNQWSNVVRWEFKKPTPFLRSREFLWQEGHTAFATKEEADKEVLEILELYRRVYEELLAVPVVKGMKTENEKFAGGLYTTSIEAYIPVVGRGIQAATSHCLGQNFAKMFNISFEDEKGERRLVWQNSWGLTTRTIGVMVMVHSDDIGLVLPPRVAPIQVIIVPIWKKDNRAQIRERCEAVKKILVDAGVRVELDDRENYTPGWKYAHWEQKGVPLRIELGMKDLENNRVTAVRRDGSKSDKKETHISMDDLARAVPTILEDIQNSLFQKAKETFLAHRSVCTTFDDMLKALDKRNVVLAPWCGRSECEEDIKKRTGEAAKELEAKERELEEAGVVQESGERLTGAAKSLNVPFEQPELPAGTKCVGCDHNAAKWVLWGRSY